MLATAPKTCFVISPIGPDGSEIRKAADDFLELLIEPALAPFNFNIIRADKIARPTIITTDIISLVQQSDLCVIDLTGHNANVYYECGRRHEAGLPFIQLIRKGETLPFDVAGIRTVYYDLTDPRSTLTSVKDIQSFVRAIETEGYAETSSGESLSSISDAIRRLERKVNRLVNPDAESRTGTVAAKSGNMTDYLLEHPRVAFMRAFEQGDLGMAASLLPRIKKILGPTAMADAAAYLARAGEPIGKSTLQELLQTADELPYEAIGFAVFGLKEYYYNTDTEKEGIEYLAGVIRNLIGQKRLQDAELAVLLNQLQMLRYSIKDYEGAERDLLKAIALAPDVIAYQYNLALIYDKQGKVDEKIASIDTYMEFDGLDADHLRHAISGYREVGRDGDAAKAEEMLRALLMRNSGQ
ncbi:MAG TPA: hypothetical protein VHG51_14285 [Longimicrobiaceae bacterium]|nr:hypothetical protein [Longimicrobiaceae bacterium]